MVWGIEHHPQWGHDGAEIERLAFGGSGEGGVHRDRAAGDRAAVAPFTAALCKMPEIVSLRVVSHVQIFYSKQIANE